MDAGTGAGWTGWIPDFPISTVTSGNALSIASVSRDLLYQNYSQLACHHTNSFQKKGFFHRAGKHKHKQKYTIGMAHSPLYPRLGLWRGALWHKMAAMRLCTWLMHNSVWTEQVSDPCRIQFPFSIHQKEALCKLSSNNWGARTWVQLWKTVDVGTITTRDHKVSETLFVFLLFV